MLFNIFPASCYDVVTVGAFTAYAQKYKNGGVAKMLQQQKEFYSADGTLSRNTKLEKACQLINNIYKHNTNIDRECQKLCDLAINGSINDLQIVAQQIMELVKDLVNICDNKLLQDAEELYNAVQEEILYQKTIELSKSHRDSCGESSTDPVDELCDSKCLSGTNFKKNPSLEPWVWYL